MDAARELFVAKGWAGTGMREIAAAAGVALETVYAHFSSKRGVLRAVADEAVVGDDAPLALAQRPEFAALGRGRRSSRISAAADLATAVNVRTAAIAGLLREAAPADAEIAELLHATRERQREDVASGLTLITGRPVTRVETDGVWAVVSPEVYLLLVEQSGWTASQYRTWIIDVLEGLIPRS